MVPGVKPKVQIGEGTVIAGGLSDSIRRASVADNKVVGSQSMDLQKRLQQQQRRRDSIQKKLQPPQNEDKEEEEDEEDDGHHIRQLIFALSDALSSNAQSRRTTIRGPSVILSEQTAAERLLDIIMRIVQVNSTGRLQYKLQDFLLEFLTIPPARIEAPKIDVQGIINKRHAYWSSLRTNCCKWELDSNVQERLPSAVSSRAVSSQLPLPPTSAGTQDPFYNSAQSFFSQKSSGGESTELSDINAIPTIKGKSFGTLHSFSSSTEGWFPSAAKTKGWFPKSRHADRTIKLPGSAGYMFQGDVPAMHIKPKLNAWLQKDREIDFDRHWYVDNWNHRIKSDVGLCPLCPCRSCSFVPPPQSRPGGRMGRRTVAIHKASEEQCEQAERSFQQDVQCINHSLPFLQPPSKEILDNTDPPYEPPQYADPFNDRKTHQHFLSAKRKYFAACEKNSMLPRMPAFLVGEAKSAIRLSDQGLLDHDLWAMVDALGIQKITEFDASKNNFSDKGLQEFLRSSHFPNALLSDLNVSFSGAADGTLGVIADMMSAGCRRLHHLHLGGVNVSDSTWYAVCDAIMEHSNLRTLDLQEAQLGRMCQRAPVKVAQLMAQLPFLDRVDLSGNFLFHDACTAIAEALSQTTSLRELDVSHNASSHLVPPKRRQKKPPQPVPKGKASKEVTTKTEYQEVANFNPILLLCEGFAANTSLESLSLSESNIDYSGDFVLMDALRGHPKLEYLDLSNNPHGEDGLRTLLRLLMPPECRIAYCNITGARDSRINGLEVKYDFSEPRGHYELDFDHPQHRSVLRMLLDKANKNNEDPDIVFGRILMNPPLPKNTSWYRKSESGWKFPVDGHLSCDYVLAKSLPPCKDPVEVVKMYYRERRIAISMGRFVTLFTMYSNLSDSHQKAMLIRAMQDQVLLKSCHLRKFLQTTPELVEVIVTQLYSTVESMDKLALFDLLKQPDANRRFRRNARAHFFLNENNPTDKYRLDLAIPSERAVAERISVINLFEMLPSNAIDNTQHGFGEGVRNASLEGIPIQHFVNRFAMQAHGTLSLDYSSPRGPSRKAATLSNMVLESVMDLLENSQCNHEDQVQALRGVSHLMTLNPSQMCELLRKVPNRAIQQKAGTNSALMQQRRKSLLSKFQRAAKKAQVYTKLGLKIKESAFQYIDTNPRISAFICFFNRCICQTDLCTQTCLYDVKMFTHACSKEIQTRIGVLRTFDALACHSPDTNCGNRFECRMFIHEEWTLAKFLIFLAAREDGENMVKCFWSERNFLAVQGYDFIPPGDWLRDLPMKGTFCATYVEEKEEYRLLNERKKLAEQLCWGYDA
eukprot:gnl/MRDRNA2_/MRDRNA2_35233_c0_seq1.p1 gnl/MRDRNA2_/MRDRNA2_35233_c0~~gnl/MRDRNA2_/MRDRNA2_35233_c0_seq1.p1  ORF type:complete len:1321 (+),score=185.20 gnl/MRDRNA2_/MRDRNA2_35233_c0_seq1:217-4179(+)